MTDAEVMIVVISEMIKQVNNDRFKKELQSIIDGLFGKVYVPVTDSPSYKSIVLFGVNIFPFSMSDYRKMANYIIKKGKGKNVWEKPKNI